MMLLVRPAVVEDAPAIIQLNIAYDDLRATAAHVAEHIAARSQFETPFVATRDGRVVGLACLRLLPSLCDPVPYAELTELIVDPQHRRAGVGRTLVARIEQEALAGGANTLVLMTAWRNGGAHAFYHALGYRLYTVTMQRSLT